MIGPMPQRIAVIGSPGAGKSTLATAIAMAAGLPLIHLDREHWQPGWVEPAPAEWHARSVALAQASTWVIDGQYSSTLPTRLRRAELIVYLDLPTIACLWGIMSRARRWRGQVRPDMGAGCPERLDGEFVRYVLGFRRRVRPQVEALLAASDVRLVRLCTTGERARFTRALVTGGLMAAMASPD